MTRRDDLQAALLTAYAQSLARSGLGVIAGAYLQRAARVENAPPSAADMDALQLAGFLNADGTLTDEGRAVLAQVLDRGAA